MLKKPGSGQAKKIMQKQLSTAGASAPKSGNLAAARTLNVLSAFAEIDGPAGVTELAVKLGMTKNMIFRALSTLQREGYLVRDDTGRRYELGMRLLELRSHAEEDPDIKALCWPYMEQMAELTGATIFLSVRSRWRQVLIDGIPGRGPLRHRIIRGFSSPLHASVASRALLAHLSDAEIAEYIRLFSPLRRFTDTTIVEPEKLWEEVAVVREKGYAISYGDHIAQRSGVAFPILDASGRPHAAVTVSGPLNSVPPSRVAAWLPGLREIAAELNRHSQLYYANVFSGAANSPSQEGGR